MSRRIPAIAAVAAVAFALALVATVVAAPPLSGAIFTTYVTGVPVNLNIYAAKEYVYLNRAPFINAPDDAARLPAGYYYFQSPARRARLCSRAMTSNAAPSPSTRPW